MTDTTYSHSIHTDVLLPNPSHPNHIKDSTQQQAALLSLLYDKICVERRTSNHELFLQFDEDGDGRISAAEFRDALDKIGVPVSDAQLGWLMTKFDGDNNGEAIDFKEFLDMLTAWRTGPSSSTTGAKAAVVDASSTGLTWKHEEGEASPGSSKKAMQAREARQQVVLQHYASLLKKKHEMKAVALGEEPILAVADQPEKEGEATMLINQVLHKLAEVAFMKLGGLKKAFAHFDIDNDHLISLEDLGHTLDHHLGGLELSSTELQALFQALDFDKRGAVHYYEFVKVLTKYAEDTEGGRKREGRWSLSALPPPSFASSSSLPSSSSLVDLAAGAETMIREGAKAGVMVVPSDPSPITTKKQNKTTAPEEEEKEEEDREILKDAADVIHERGLHAHGLLKQLLPECEGKVDAAGIQKVFEKLGLPISQECAKRFLVKADLLGQGWIVSWEFVRLISSAATAGKSSSSKRE